MLKRNLSKKEVEKILLSSFISNESLGLRVKSIEESETPDFIIEALHKTFSIELTRLIHPATIEKEALQEKLVQMAKALFKLKHEVELCVLVTFSNVPIKCNAIELQEHAKALVQIVENIYLANCNYEFAVSSERHQHMNRYISKLSVANNKGLENWQHFNAYKVEYVDVDWVKGKIAEKENRLHRYHMNYEENWLLLVANFGHKSSTYRFYHLRQEMIDTKFDKVYLYKYREAEIVELK